MTNPAMYRVLLIEPAENVAVAVRALLEQNDFHVDVVPSANEVDESTLPRYAVLVVDVRLQDRAGFAFLERVHRTQPHLAGRVVVISADESAAIARELEQLGVCGLVPKPLNAEEIVRAVFECLDTSQPS